MATLKQGARFAHARARAGERLVGRLKRVADARRGFGRNGDRGSLIQQQSIQTCNLDGAITALSVNFAQATIGFVALQFGAITIVTHARGELLQTIGLILGVKTFAHGQLHALISFTMPRRGDFGFLGETRKVALGHGNFHRDCANRGLKFATLHAACQHARAQRARASHVNLTAMIQHGSASAHQCGAAEIAGGQSQSHGQ